MSLLFAAAFSVQAATYYVSPSGNDANSGASLGLAKQTIQAAINVAASGDTVLVADGTYAPISINSGITVCSVNGAQATIIDGGGVTRCAYVATNAMLDGFTVTNGYSSIVYGGGVFVEGGTVANCTINGNSAGEGGGAFVGWGGMVQNCTISGNVASSGGGGVFVCFGGTVQNCTISGNLASYYGGGGVEAWYGIVQNCTISGNSADWGGGVEAWGGTVQNCTISGNSADYVGGGVFVYDGIVQNCTIVGNSAYNGGGVHVFYGTVQNCTIVGNSAYYGGGVFVYDGIVQNCTISGNSAYRQGGGVHVEDGTVQNCTINGNTALWGWGGGVQVYSSTLQNCTISGNSAGPGGGGVAIVNSTARNCLISGNRANDLGGGVEVEGGLVENCTITRNSVFSDDGSHGLGGGMYIQAGTVRNCIVHDNEDKDVMGPNTSYISYSCLGTEIPGTGNITNPPQFFSTGTGYGTNLVSGNYRLKSTSPCINAGLNQSWMAGAVDLDDLPRIIGGVVDMGAYEWNTEPGVIQFSPSSYQVNEDAGVIILTVTRTRGSYGSASVEYATADGTALAGSDYTLQSGTLSWADGDASSKTITVAIIDDSLDENDETFTVTLSNALGAVLGSAHLATVTIIDNDEPDDEDPPESVVDMEASDFRFLPVNLWAGDHPAMISFDLLNEGPADLVAPETRLEITFCLSSNTIFVDEDDLAIGTKSEEITLSAGAQTTIRYPGRAHNEDVTIPEGLAGDFYVFVRVRLVSQTGLTDPDGAVAMREGPIRVRIHPSDDGDDSGGGGNSKQRSVLNDYDADGKSDMMAYDEESGEWAIQFSSSGAAARFIFGGLDYEAVPGDYDGDFKTDPAVHKRNGPAWQIMLSGLGYETVSFGFDVGTETRGAVGDYNGDELADPGLYEEKSGRWYVLLQDKQGNFEVASALFGGSGLAPVVGDYDGDSRADPAVYEEATGGWLVMLSAQGYGTVSAGFGGPGYHPVPADYDGDGKTDLAIMDASGGWYYRLSGRSYALSGPDEFGQSGQSATADKPVPADYDGDGKADPAVRDSSGNWYFWLSGSSYTRAGPYSLTRP